MIENRNMMSDGSSRDLFLARRSLWSYTRILLFISLFYLGYSILSCIIVRNIIDYIGLVAFLFSTSLYIYLLLGSVINTGKCTIILLAVANVADTMYFLLRALSVQDRANNTYIFIMFWVFFAIFFFSIFLGYFRLSKVQKLHENDLANLQMENDDDANLERSNPNHV